MPADRAATPGRWIAPAAILLFALIVRLLTLGAMDFPGSEVSAYYFGVARNLLEGRGLVSDAIWTFATEPLVFPRPAFEVWLPLPTFLAAIPMAALGPSFASAQLSTIVVGSFIPPLTWAVARDAAARHGIPGARAETAAMGAGLLAAILGPFLIADAAPESTTPFTALVLLAALLTPMAVNRSLRGQVGLGATLGLAYLARQEAVYVGIAYLIFVMAVERRRYGPGSGDPSRRRSAIAALAPVVAAGAVVVAPWLLRNRLTFGSFLPGQTMELAYLTRNEELFSYATRPTLGSFLAQGPGTILEHLVDALTRNLVDLVLIAAAPVGLLGLIAIVALRRSAALRPPAPLALLLLVGLLVYAVASLVFPVASAYGTFRHAAGPLLAGLIVTSVLGLDAAVARLGRIRRWERSNAWLGPAIALAAALPLAALQVSVQARQAQELERRLAAVVATLEAQPDFRRPPLGATKPRREAAVISDRPIWLAEVLRAPVVALPDETPRQVWQLARDFNAPLVAIINDRGAQAPSGVRMLLTSACFELRAIDNSTDGERSAILAPMAGCLPALAAATRLP
ncbi:MAG: hypothetical protein H0X16_06765 [Chloroflexi bacterium]|nr:hypothetical protein [Chloroflexota bacterium]